MSFRDTLTLKPTGPEVVRLNAWLDKAFARSGISPRIAADLKLCLNEVVVNLISYAFPDTANPQISVEIELQAHTRARWKKFVPTAWIAQAFGQRVKAVGVGETAKVEVRDNGTFFDIRNWPVPPTPRDLISAPIGGYGILLIRDRASSIDYDRIDGVNRLRITCSGDAPETERREP